MFPNALRFRRIHPVQSWHKKRQSRFWLFWSWFKFRLGLVGEWIGKTWEETVYLTDDFVLFCRTFWWYIGEKTKIAAHRFEKVKGYLVSFLIIKRGRYSRSFLNLSFFLLTVAAFIVTPVIASSYPGINREELAQFSPPSAVATSLNESEMGVSTFFSEKPRDRVITYRVQKGDTLFNIAQTFGISEDTIRWAGNLKSDKLSIGQELKVPPVTGIVHTVREGDTVYAVAKRYKTDPQQIANFPFNDFEDLDTFALKVGQTLVVPNGVKPEAPAIARIALVPQVAAQAGGLFIWPSQGEISQYPVWYHMALDIANKAAPAILASRTGKVIYSACLRWGYGCHIIIDHGDGYQTLYGHLAELSVNIGASVGQGLVIGRMGSTGRSTGAHLHFEIRRNGTAINPIPFLQR